MLHSEHAEGGGHRELPGHSDNMWKIKEKCAYLCERQNYGKSTWMEATISITCW